MDDLNLFHHVFINNNAPKTLFLLHGTGGDENDLLPLAQNLNDSYNFVGLRGNVSEQGMPSFFTRVGPGVFDQASILQETQKLAKFIEAWYQTYQSSSANTSFLGYSNGANMILATLFNFPQLIDKAVLLHPMLPFTPKSANFTKKAFLITYGETDSMIRPSESLQVIDILKKYQATVEVFSHPGGHEIIPREVNQLEQFLNL